MVTNLTAEAKAIWARASQAKDPKVKLSLLKEFYSKMPHHKGTEKLEVTIKRQMTSLREEIEGQKIKRRGQKIDPWTLTRGDFIQTALVATLDKSAKLFYDMTGLKVGLYDVYNRPVVGPFTEGGVIIQVYLAPIDRSSGVSLNSKSLKIIRQVDLLLVERGGLGSGIRELLSAENIEALVGRRSRVEIKRTSTGGIRIIGSSTKIDNSSIARFLTGYGLKSCIVRVESDTLLDDVESALFGRIQKPTIEINIDSKADMLKMVLNALGLIRVYTISKSKSSDDRPILLNRGSTVQELGGLIHKELQYGFKYAMLQRNCSSTRVGRNFVLKDEDMVELASSLT